MNKIKPIMLGILCSVFSLTLLVLPNVQGTASSTNTVISEDNPCGEQGVKEVITGKNRLIGCWGNDGTCKIKCFEPELE